MVDLAAVADVATVLGLADADALTPAQSIRLPSELARVQRAFMRAAGRDFQPGPVRVQCTTLGGWVTLLDTPLNDDGDPVTVEDRHGHELSVLTSDGARLRVGHHHGVHHRALPSGEIVNVSYIAPAVPDAVRVAVASIVARRLSVQIGSPETKFTDLTAGADYRAAGAAWLTSTAVLTDDERCEAESYRPVAGTAIIARWDDHQRAWMGPNWFWPGYGLWNLYGGGAAW